ncbi:MAG: hypothetical protein J0I21_00175 [Alphaproteobacteria bacterium]|nr:hypothetical protein [Alphaproteobacteria bacterium]
MRRVFAPRGRSWYGLAGRWLAAVAIAVQLAAASVVVLPSAPVQALEGLIAASICDGVDTHGPESHHHHAPACTLCPLCQAIAHAGMLLAPPGFTLAAPTHVKLRMALLPPARAPPARDAGAAYPRGPPLPV